ncbi:MAG: ATP-binding protein [Hyphomicrobiaceae bacterium]
MRLPTRTVSGEDARVAELQRRVSKLEKINAALMNRVERSLDHQANGYAMFQTAIGLESQVRVRTEELKSALRHLESLNCELCAARDQAEQANSVKTRFFTSVGHDVLQPLHAARLSLSALSDGTQSEEQRRLASQIDHALSSIEQLLRTILDISKLEAGMIRPKLQQIALAPLFRSLTVDLEPLLQAKGLRIASPGTSLGVTTDALMLRRMLQNLLANALHYTREGGVLLGARPRGREVHIEVWDTGPGIPVPERERIFEEFQRGSTSGETNRGGFGLGLSIVNRMAQTLDHRVELTSVVGRGTRFTIIAPRADNVTHDDDEAEAGMAQAPVHPALGLGPANVLVLDNDASVLAAMQNLLSRWSCRTCLVRDSDEIEEVLGAGAFQPDIVLADYHLDGGALGTDAVRQLRAALGRDVPAIVITADHGPETAGAARDARCELLYKPVRPAELRALMQHLLLG